MTENVAKVVWVDHRFYVAGRVRECNIWRQQGNEPRKHSDFQHLAQFEWDRKWATIDTRDRFTSAIGGDLPIRSITVQHIRAYKAALLTSVSARTGKAIAPATVEKFLNALKSVLAFALPEGYITASPAAGVKSIAKKDPRAHDTTRQPYSQDDLRAIFSKERLEEREDHGGARQWLPWLALYTGARLEELGQLHTADIREEDNTSGGSPLHYISIAPGDGKRVKTKSSKRRIPVHPRLTALGLLRFVEEQKTAGEVRLFPELKADRDGKVTSTFSKWWGRYTHGLGITDERKVWHSFRHGFKDAARGVMPEEHHDAITGHSNGSVGPILRDWRSAARPG